MSIIIYGVEDGQCHSSKGFRKEFAIARDADIYIQTMCNKIHRDELGRYAMYITNEYRTLDEVMHFHNWHDTDLRYRDDYDKIEKVDIAVIKQYIDVEYQNYLNRQTMRRLETKQRVNNMDAAAVEYHAKLFKQLNVQL